MSSRELLPLFDREFLRALLKKRSQKLAVKRTQKLTVKRFLLFPLQPVEQSLQGDLQLLRCFVSALGDLAPDALNQIGSNARFIARLPGRNCILAP
jgi:hypothetical protein